MNKKLKNILIEASILIGGVYFFNNIYPSLTLISNRQNTFLNNKIQEKTNISKEISRYNIKDAKASDVLYLSNMITSAHFFKGYSENISNKRNIDKDLENNVADCYIISNFTYSNYLFIIKQAKKTELLKEVKVASGYKYIDGKWVGHRWLEYKIDNQWKIFESTLFLDYNMNFKSGNLSFDDVFSSLENIDPSKYYALTYTSLNQKNNLIKNIVWSNALTDTHGLGYKLFKGKIFDK